MADAAYPNISEAVRDFVSKPRKMLINGEWVEGSKGQTLSVIDPATGKELTTVPAGDASDIDRAVAAARDAFEGSEWRAFRPVDRERFLLKLADAIEARAAEFAELEALDNGKSVVLAKAVDVRSTVDYIRYAAGWATKIEGSTIDVSLPRPKDGGEWFAYTRREPVGVVGAIIPWNFPLLMCAFKVAPALACGCTVVVKPAEETPLTALLLGEVAMSLGLPKGVLNVVTGDGLAAGAPLSQHKGINKVAFTGSTEVGKLIGKAAVQNMTRFSLELGGKSPMIVFPDCDPATVIKGSANGIFYNTGQVCAAASRLYVHRKLYDQVVEGVAAIAKKTRLGPGMDPKANMGPVVSQKQLERVLGYIDAGKRDGATVVTGGARADMPGYFVQPTVLTDTRPDMQIIQEEIFGPVLSAIPFEDVEEVAKLANHSNYGLAASIWTNDLSAVQRLVPRLHAGTVWVNAHTMVDPAMPFGGFKQSGIGRESGRAMIDLYTETKTVCILA